MPKGALLLVVGLLVGFGVGFTVAATRGTTVEVVAPVGAVSGEMGHEDHHHMLREVGPEGPAPTLEVVLHPDGPGSMNLEMLIENFRFAPEAVNGPHVPGEGHAHVYVDGRKLPRAYAPWVQLTGIAPGAEIRVTLNANSHEELTVDGVPVAALITVPQED